MLRRDGSATPGSRSHELRVDGGASRERPADAVPGRSARRAGRAPEGAETTALGAAYLAGLAVGYWKNTDDIRANWQVDRRFEPAMTRDQAAALTAGWDKAVARAKGWA